MWGYKQHFLAGRRKHWKSLDGRSPSRDWNPGPFENEQGCHPHDFDVRHHTHARTRTHSYHGGGKVIMRRRGGGWGGMRGNQECLKYPKWLAVLMAAFLFLFRASCGRSCSSPGINLIPSVDQRRRSVRFVVTLNCLITRWQRYKMSAFYCGYPRKLQQYFQRFFDLLFCVRKCLLIHAMIVRHKMMKRLWLLICKWCGSESSWTIILFQYLTQQTVSKIKHLI